MLTKLLINFEVCCGYAVAWVNNFTLSLTTEEIQKIQDIALCEIVRAFESSLRQCSVSSISCSRHQDGGNLQQICYMSHERFKLKKSTIDRTAPTIHGRHS